METFLVTVRARRFFIRSVVIACAVLVSATVTAHERTEPLGRLRGRFIAFPSDESVRRVFSVATDSQGRVIAANGRIGIYDGYHLRELPAPAGVHTGAVAVDAQDRIWAGNHEDFGYYVETAAGWTFTSVKHELPAGVAPPEFIWSVHCIGDVVFFIGSNQVLVRSVAGMRVLELPALRRLFASKLGEHCYVWQRGQTLTRLWRINQQAEAELLFSVPEFFSAYDVLRDEGDEIEFIMEFSRRAKVRAGEIVKVDENPVPEISIITAAPLPEGGYLIGTLAQGVRRFDREWQEMWGADVASGDLVDHAAEAIALGKGGVVWSVSSLGLTGMDALPAVTTFAAADGAPSGINAILRHEGALHFATSTGIFSAARSREGRRLQFEKLSEAGQFANDFLSLSGVGLVMAGQNVHRLPQREWGFSLQRWSTGRSILTLQARPSWLLLAQTDQLLVRETHAEVAAADRPWPIVWSEPVRLLDRAFALPGTAFLWADLAGRVERRDLRVADGVVTGTETKALTAPSGVGRIVRFEWLGEDVLAFTRDGVWRSPRGAEKFEPLRADTAAHVKPFAFVWENEFEGWGVAAVEDRVAGQVASGHAVWRVRRSPTGDITGFVDPPRAYFDGIGLLTCAWREGDTWWLGASGGLARVELPWLHEREPLALARAPRIREVREGGEAALDSHASATLAGSRELEAEWSHAPHEHGMPVWIETRLEPIESDWSVLSGLPRQRFPALPAGNYRLAARAVDVVGTRSPETVWEFAVAPRFRESWLFPASLVVAIGAFAAVLLAWRVRDMKRRRAELERTVTERTAALQVANEELHRLNKRRVEFVGAVSHELRTPLAGARMMADQIMRRPEPEAARQLRRCLVDLEQLLEGSLDLSRYELGLIPVQLRWVRLAEWFRQVTAPFEALALEKGLSFKMRIDAAAGEAVLLDEPNARRVVANLLSNAIKYTSSGGVDVDVATSAMPLGEGFARLKLSVRDSGGGITEAQRATLFGEFKRVAWNGGEANGHGLGLVLTRQLVEVSGGEIGCISEPGAGSTFTVEFPVATSSAEDPAPPFAADVLVVEDEDSHATHAADVLEPLGATVHRARSVAEFTRIAAGRKFELALIDFNLPDGTGLDVLEKLRQREPRPRCVLLSHIRSEEMRALCLERGFDGVLAKPLSVGAAMTELAACARDATQNVRSTDANQTRPSES